MLLKDYLRTAGTLQALTPEEAKKYVACVLLNDSADAKSVVEWVESAGYKAVTSDYIKFYILK